MADRNASTIKSDKQLAYLSKNQKGRAERGKTFAGRANKKTNLVNKRKNRANKKNDFRWGQKFS